MNTNRGFTLIEVLIAAGVLACGLAAAAAVFSYAIRTNDMNRRSAAAAALLYDKMEEFRSAPVTHPIWMTAAGTETVVIAGDRYTRTWEIDANTPRRVTVIVYAQRRAPAQGQAELVRAATLVSPGF